MCEDKIQLVIALDSSNAVGSCNWNHMKTFASRLVSHMRLHQESVTANVISFGDSATLEVSSHGYHDLNDLQKLIANSRYHSGSSRIDLALDLSSRLFENHKDPDVRKVILMVTSLSSNSDVKESLLMDRVSRLKESGAELFMVNIGQANVNYAATKEKLLDISSKPMHLHTLAPESFAKAVTYGTAGARMVCRNVA